MPRSLPSAIREAPVDAVIFDTDGQDEESFDAFLDMHERAHEDGHQLVALVLLGVKQDALRERLPTNDRLIVLGKPIKMKQVQDALQRLVPLNLIGPPRVRNARESAWRSISSASSRAARNPPLGRHPNKKPSRS